MLRIVARTVQSLGRRRDVAEELVALVLHLKKSTSLLEGADAGDLAGAAGGEEEDAGRRVRGARCMGATVPSGITLAPAVADLVVEHVRGHERV
jgi:hypothetical protein